MTKQRNKKAKKHIIYIYKKRHDNDMTQDDDPHYEINYTQKIASAKHNNEKIMMRSHENIKSGKCE